MLLTIDESIANVCFILSASPGFVNVPAPCCPMFLLRSASHSVANAGSVSAPRILSHLALISFKCQILSLYSVIVLSEENTPLMAVLVMAIRCHFF